MLAHFVKLLNPSDDRRQAYLLYAELVKHARNPVYFAEYGVPDTLDGRFELIVLHLFLLLQRLQGETGIEQTQQWLIEAFFDDMDRSLRELGVGDTGVGHRIKRMAGAFYGRNAAYKASWEGPAAFADALMRNVYGTLGSTADPAPLATACRVFAAHLAAQPLASLLKGDFGA